MKIRIIKGAYWYAKEVGNIFEVRELKGNDYRYAGYEVIDGVFKFNGILKDDAEVVEDEKQDCSTCRFDPNGCVLMGVECDNFSKWKPVEKEKSCETYRYDKFNILGETGCQHHAGICEYYEKWQPIEPTISKTETVEKSCKTCGSDDCHLCGKDHIKWKPQETTKEKFARLEFEKELPQKKPLINLIKVTTQSGFSRYVNPTHIISITEIEGGTSVATTDRDGDYLVVDSIGDVLKKLGVEE